MYPPELQLNIIDTSESEATFLDLHLSKSRICFLQKIMTNTMTLILIL